MSNRRELNISIDKDLWDDLRAFASEQTLARGKRFPVIQALRMAIKIFLRLEISEINSILDREPRKRPTITGDFEDGGRE